MRNITLSRHKALYIGVDVHKDTHAAVATDCFGQTLFQKNIGNYRSDFKDLASVVMETSKNNGLIPVFGLEDRTSVALGNI